MSFPDRFAARAAGTLVLAGFPDGGSTSPNRFSIPLFTGSWRIFRFTIRRILPITFLHS